MEVSVALGAAGASTGCGGWHEHRAAHDGDRLLPGRSPQTAYYLSRRRGEITTYGLPVVGAVLVTEYDDDGKPVDAGVRLAYLDEVSIVELHEGPTLIGIFDGDEKPTEYQIEYSRIQWELTLEINRMESALYHAIQELVKEYDELRRNAPGRYDELQKELAAKREELKKQYSRDAYAARERAHEAQGALGGAAA